MHELDGKAPGVGELSAHYNNGTEYQHWDFAYQRYGRGYFLGNATKYITRWRHKGQGVADLEKARDYLRKLIVMEAGQHIAGVMGVNGYAGHRADEVRSLVSAYELGGDEAVLLSVLGGTVEPDYSELAYAVDVLARMIQRVTVEQVPFNEAVTRTRTENRAEVANAVGARNNLYAAVSEQAIPQRLRPR